MNRRQRRKRFRGESLELPLIVEAPTINGGAPTIRGTRILAECVWERYCAGDGTSFLARDYDVTIDAIRAAVKYARTHWRYDNT